MIKKRCITPMSQDKLKEIDEFQKENLAKGFIQPSKTSPVFFIPKKDGGKCLVTNYCHLNSDMIKNNYLLPLILQSINKLKGCDMFIKMDLC